MTCDTCDSFGYLLTAPATYQSGGEMVSCPVCQPSLTADAVKAANLADFEMVDELRRRGWSVRPAVKPTEAGAIDCLSEQYEAEGSPLTAEELRAGGNPHNSRWTIRAMLAFARNLAAPSQGLDAKEGVTLYREVDALGGTGEGDWHAGYTEALTEVLNILTKRGFTEAADAKDGGQRVAFYWKDGSDIREGESLSDRDRRIYEQGRRDERVGEPEAFQ